MLNSISCSREMTEQDCTVEIIDLDPCDTASKSRHSKRAYIRMLAWRHNSKRGWLWHVASAICIVGLLAVLYNLSVGFPSFMTLQLQRAFAQSSSSSFPHSASKQDGIACQTDAAWSPDRTVIAVIGSAKGCLREDTEPGLINLYDASTRKLLTQLRPDDAIWHMLNRPQANPPGHRLVIPYVHIFWSRDGKRLACTFEIMLKQTSFHGVLLMDRDGGHIQVLLQQQQPSVLFYAKWDNEVILSDTWETLTIWNSHQSQLILKKG